MLNLGQNGLSFVVTLLLLMLMY